MLHKITFDTTDADTIAASHKILSGMISTDGSTLITDTTVGGDTGLDVNIINTSLTATISGDVNVTQGTSPWVVSATDLDTRDLTFATDKVDASGSEVSLDAATLAALETTTVEQGTSPWVVSATDLDIRDLAFATDSVDVSGSSIDATLAAPNTAILASATALAAGGTGEAIVTSSLADRKSLRVFNNSNKNMFFGQSGVTASNGYPIPAGSELPLLAGPSITPHFVGQTTGQEIRVLEIS